MHASRSSVAALAAVLAVGSWVLVQAGQQPPAPPSPSTPAPVLVPPMPQPRMPLAPGAVAGASVTPALEGWFRNADGTATILMGYSNRNQSQTLDIPVGPNNRIEPNGPDYGQPTHFLTGGSRNGRQYGLFTITVPKDFGTKKLTWTLVANGQPQSIALWLNQPYVVAPFFRSDNGNSPPVVKFSPTGPEFTGPPRDMAQTLTATVAEPVTLTLWATDKGNTVDQQNQFGPPPPPGRGRGGASGGGAAGAADQAAPAGAGTPAAGGRGAGAGGGAGAAAGRGGGGGRGGNNAPIQITWEKQRTPATGGDVKFSEQKPTVAPDPEVAKLFAKPGDFSGKATTTATFSAPGEYVVRAQVNDASGDGGGGDQCCWTNVLVKVTVKAAAAGR